MSEYVLRKEYEDFREYVRQEFHENELDKVEIRSDTKQNSDAITKILENSEWMKRVWIKAIITMVCSVVGAIILSTLALVWYLVEN